MLRGYIKTFYFPLDTSKTSREKINQEKIVSILGKEKLVDYIEYKSSSNTLIITRNPFGFTSRIDTKRIYIEELLNPIVHLPYVTITILKDKIIRVN